ncbi:uncharacterized protein LOC125501536 [Athalia rosae]|uniref:uncharacterized protein LOC125501536 n=1 Tax=Athalia rosae TaxID=37344 RepID=UPI002033617B|nr:uncharacterized protein LOC125501536 [Athalia rosae]
MMLISCHRLTIGEMASGAVCSPLTTTFPRTNSLSENVVIVIVNVYGSDTDGFRILGGTRWKVEAAGAMTETKSSSAMMSTAFHDDVNYIGFIYSMINTFVMTLNVRFIHFHSF